MTKTFLTELIRKQTATSVVGAVTRSIDVAAEKLASEMLRDPKFRARMRQLIDAAFEQALKELNEPTSEEA